MSERSSNSPQVVAAEPKLIFERGSKGRSGFFWPNEGEEIPPAIPGNLLRRDIAGFPELSELETLRHFTRLSQKNFAIESQFYPLGSCTMKYNPKRHERLAGLSRLVDLHP